MEQNTVSAPALSEAESSENEETQQRWPFSAARSTGTEHQDLLTALLAAGTLEEISNADDYDAVARYIRSQGRVDMTGKIRCGLVFWLYPTGLYGPYHEVQGGVHKHGALITVEQGALEHVGGRPASQ